MNTETQGTRVLVLEALANFPHSSAREVADLVPGTKTDIIKKMCASLWEKGELDREVGPYPDGRNSGRRPYVYKIAENPQPREPKPRVGKIRKPSAAGYEVRLQALQVRISELEQWRNDAIIRYPDLAVPDVVLRARKIVAEQLESHDAHGKAETLAGRRDHTMLIKAVVAALESA